MTEIIKCIGCGKKKKRIKTEEKSNDGRSVYRGECGLQWRSRRCPDCVRLDVRKRAGHVPVDEVKWHKIKKGRESEHIARKYFEKFGFQVEMTRFKGPDLILRKDGRTLTCEVKSAVKSTGCKKSMFSGKIYPTRQKDDLIAIVFPNGEVYSENMKMWMMQSNNNGSRMVHSLQEKA